MQKYQPQALDFEGAISTLEIKWIIICHSFLHVFLHVKIFGNSIISGHALMCLKMITL